MFGMKKKNPTVHGYKTWDESKVKKGENSPWMFHGIAPKNKTSVQSAHKALFGHGFGSTTAKTPTSTKGLKEVHLYMKVGPVAPVKKIEPKQNDPFKKAMEF